MEADSSLIYYVPILTTLLILSALFSSSETAIFSVNKIKLEHLVAKGNKKALKIYSLLKKPADLIATILICNEIVNIAISSIFTIIVIKTFGKESFYISIPVTFMVLLTFGEILPKTLAARISDRYAMLIAPLIKGIYLLVYPIRAGLVLIALIPLKLFDAHLLSKRKTGISEEEFIALIEESEKFGAIKEEEKEIIKKTLQLGETRVKQIMTPKNKIFAFNEEETVERAIREIMKVKFSRIPLYSGDINNITGILYAKKIIPSKFRKEKLKLPVKYFADKPFFSHEDERINTLLQKMQKERKHMAIVTDHKGRTRGVVTLDDIISFLINSNIRSINIDTR